MPSFCDKVASSSSSCGGGGCCGRRRSREHRRQRRCPPLPLMTMTSPPRLRTFFFVFFFVFFVFYPSSSSKSSSSFSSLSEKVSMKVSLFFSLFSCSLFKVSINTLNKKEKKILFVPLLGPLSKKNGPKKKTSRSWKQRVHPATGRGVNHHGRDGGVAGTPNAETQNGEGTGRHTIITATTTPLPSAGTRSKAEEGQPPQHVRTRSSHANGTDSRRAKFALEQPHDARRRRGERARRDKRRRRRRRRRSAGTSSGTSRDHVCVTYQVLLSFSHFSPWILCTRVSRESLYAARRA